MVVALIAFLFFAAVITARLYGTAEFARANDHREPQAPATPTWASFARGL